MNKKWLYMTTLIIGFLIPTDVTYAQHTDIDAGDRDLLFISEIKSNYVNTITIPQNHFTLAAMQEVITGVVTDYETGEPLAGVNISVKGTTRGTTTDGDGNYELTVNDLQGVLVFSFIGYQRQEVSIQSRTNINITLIQEINVLEDMVVIGFGQQRKGTITSSIKQVSMEDVANVSVTSADELIQGRVAGVEVNSASGVPGGGISFQIRGASSISGDSSPLYVIDGIPISRGSYGLSTGGETTNSLAFLSSGDIESITILKDAAATAIYGANAANGVIIIETKSGRSGAPQIQLGISTGFQKAVNELNLVNGPQFETLMNEFAQNSGRPKPYANPDDAINTSWPDLVFRTGTVQNYDVSVSGSKDNINYLVSGNHNFNRGILNPLSFERTNIRTKVDMDLTDKLKLGANLFYSSMERNRRNDNDGTAGRGVLGGALWFMPNLPVYQPDGSYTRCCFDDNPLASINETSHIMMTDRFSGTGTVAYELTPNIIASGDWTYDKTTVNEEVYVNSKTQYGGPANGQATSSYFQLINTTGQANLNYVEDFDKHHFNVIIGGSYNNLSQQRTTASGSQFPDDNLKRLGSAAVLSSTSSGGGSALVSSYARIQYDFDMRYMATLTMRYDGSSKFGKDNRWGAFPALGLGWNIGQESFFEVEKISQLKLRGSYGVTGNQNGLGNYASLGLWTGQRFDEQPGIRPSQLENPKLKWETTYKLNIGTDIGLFNDRVLITFDYYSDYTKDLLYAMPVPFTTGYSSVIQNIGELSNKGLEFTINADLMQRNTFGWNIDFNISRNRNKIEKIPSSFTTGIRDIYLYQVGLPMYSFYAHKQLGVNSDDGSIIMADIDGDGVFNPNTDRTVVGNANPDFFGGITNRFNYKQFDLSFFVYFKYGNKQANIDRYFAEHGGTRNQNFYATQLDRWQKSGDETMVPKMVASNYQPSVVASRFIEDASYIRIKNITIGYNFSPQLSQKAGIKQFRLYVTGENLFTITKYTGMDPELTSSSSNPLVKGMEFLSVPHAKAVTFGVNITF